MLPDQCSHILMNSNTRKKLKMKTVGQQGIKMYSWLFEVGGDREREMPRSPSNRSQVPDTAIARHIGLTISYLMSLHSHCSPALAQILYKLAIVSRATKVSPMDGLITGNYDSTGSLLQSSSLYSSWRYFAFLFFRSRTGAAD